MNSIAVKINRANALLLKLKKSAGGLGEAVMLSHEAWAKPLVGPVGKAGSSKDLVPWNTYFWLKHTLYSLWWN